MSEDIELDVLSSHPRTTSQFEDILNEDIKKITHLVYLPEPEFANIQDKDNFYSHAVEDTFGYRTSKDILGSGGFGTVTRVYRDDGREAALKTMFIKIQHVAQENGQLFFLAGADRVLRNFKREVLVMSILSGHENVVSLYNHGIINNRLFIFMELVDGGSLKDLQTREEVMTEEVAKKFFLDLIFGLHHMHSKGIAHMDFKPANILVKRTDDPQGSLKIADFGVSRVAFSREHGPLPVMEAEGTFLIMGPEVFQCMNTKKPYYPMINDIWSLGVTLCAMYLKSYPYRPMVITETIQKMKDRNYRLPDLDTKSPAFRDLIENIFEPDPMKRITLRGLLSHPWLVEQSGLRVNTDYLPPIRPYRLMRLPSLMSLATFRESIPSFWDIIGGILGLD